MMGLQKELDAAAALLRAEDPTISLISGTELFLRFVTRAATGDTSGFEKCKVRRLQRFCAFPQRPQQSLVERADSFLERSSSSRLAIGKMLVDRFLRDGTVVLVHGTRGQATRPFCSLAH